MSCTGFRGGLESSEKLVRIVCYNIVKIRMRGGGGGGVKYNSCDTPINANNR